MSTDVISVTPQPPGLRERRAQETRQALAAAARTLFLLQGYAETTIDQITNLANVSPRTFFRYFKSKEELLYVDFDEQNHRLFATLEERPTDEHPLHSLVLTLVDQITLVEELGENIYAVLKFGNEDESVNAYTRSLLQSQTVDKLAEFIGRRLGVDAYTDPRPQGWASALMACHAEALRWSVMDKRPIGSARQMLVEMLSETGMNLCTALEGLGNERS